MGDLGVVDGQRRRKTVYGKTQREVRDRLNEVLRDHKRGVLPKSGRLTVEQWLQTWLKSVKASVRPRTAEHYDWIVRDHLVPGIGRKELSRLAPSDVETMLNAELKAGLSPRTVHHIRAVLRNALKTAERDGLAAALAKPPKVPKVEMRTFRPDEVKTFLAAIAGNRLEALYVTTLGLGLRLGEVTDLRWADIDLVARTLRISRALQYQRGPSTGKPVLVEPKSASSRRTLTLPEPVLEALRRHRVRWLEEKLALGPRWLDTWDLVFVGPYGEPLTPWSVGQGFKAILAAPGLPVIRFHDLWHSCASLLLLHGVPARMVQEILGHSSIGLTLGRIAT